MEYKKVNLEDFGGKFDDPTFDNGPIIKRAIAFLHKHGGGTLDMKGRMVMIHTPLDIECTAPITIIFPEYFNTIDMLKYPKKISLMFEKRSLEKYIKGPTSPYSLLDTF